MLLFLVGLIALAALGLSAALAMRLQQFEARLVKAERGLGAPSLPELPDLIPERHLQGLHISLAIKQDHAHPVVANLLKEALLREDVADVILGEVADGIVPDLIIEGEVTCNGYAEIYYSANLVCRTAGRVLRTVSEKPAHGDRPSNLVIEVVARLKDEMDKVVTRDERRRALRELNEP